MKNQISLSNLETVQYFYSSLLDEVKHGGYNPQEISLLGNTTTYYGRYLNPSLRNYFIQTVIPHLVCAISYFSIDRPKQLIFDLGCGLGMQSIIFASLGATVVAVDRSEEAISLCKRRKSYYEIKLNIDLNIDFIYSDFHMINQRKFNSKFDCLFSMAAFNSIKPLDTTVGLISSILKPNAKVFLYDGNSTHPLSSLGASTSLSTEKAINAFKREGFEKYFLYGGCSLPRYFWRFPLLNRPFLQPVNNLLRKSLFLSFSYVLGLKRSAV